jgi:hypothetical protein
LVKKYLYLTLRGTLNKNWVGVLEKVVNDMNNTPIKRLGYLKPKQINSEIDSVFVKNAQKSYKINIYEEPNWKIQLQNQKSYKTNIKNIQIGDYVYRDLDEKLFDKAYDVSVIFLTILSMTFKSTKLCLFSITCFLLLISMRESKVL